MSLIANSFESAERRSEDERYAALLALEEYPTAAIAEVVARAIDDPATSVQRQAMGMCVARRILACQPAAARRALAKDAELSTRVRALEVIALDATHEAWTTLLLEAVDDPLPGLQLAALGLVGFAPLAPTREADLALRLRAKLADPDPEVRAASCRALGLRRDPRALPLLLAALEDPDPVVIEAAVEALGGLGRAGALPALARTVEDASAPSLQRKLIVAIASLPGRDAERLLLDRLRPASEAQREWIVRAAATRVDASDAFLRDVAALLRDPDLHDDALRLLAEHGARAHDVIRDVLEAGVEPVLAASLTDILAASARAEVVNVAVAPHRAADDDPLDESRLDGVASRARVRSIRPDSQPSLGGATVPRWHRAVDAAAAAPADRRLTTLRVSVDDALSANQPPDLWIEGLWTLLLAEPEPHRSTRRARRALRWSLLAATTLERTVRDDAAPAWLRCTAWAALVTTPLPRRTSASLAAFEQAKRRDPFVSPPIAGCLDAWPWEGSAPD